MSSSLQYILTDVWETGSDPFVSTLFGIRNHWSFIAFITGILLLIKKNERNSRTEKEPVYVKPTLLVLYGLLFGVSGAGTLLALAATSGGKDCFRCVDREALSIMSVSMRYLGYAYLCTNVFEFWMLSLEAAQARISSTSKLTRNITWIMVTFIALKFLPVGYYAFCPLMHCIQRTFTYGTLVLESASAELNFVDKSWRRTLKTLEILSWFIICIQQYWVYSSLNCEMSWVNLMGSVAAGFNAVSIIME